MTVGGLDLMDFNQDKGSLIREEQKIADNLVKKMSEELDELDEEYQKIVTEANKAIDSHNHDEYAFIIHSNKKISTVKETKKYIYTSRDSLYQRRIVLKTQGNGKEKIREIKIGLKDCMVGAKQFISSWKNPACLPYMTDNFATEFNFASYHHTLLFKQRTDFRFAKVTDTVNEYPMIYDEKTLHMLIGSGAFSDDYLYQLLENYSEMEVSDKSDVKQRLYDEFLKELVKRRSGSEFRNIVFSIQKKQGEIIKAPFQQDMIVQGCAGAGKSMIMFHRLSMLIYKAEQEKYSRIFVITPSEIYIQMANNMLYELEVQLIRIGTLKQYYDYCLQKYNIKQENVYGKINPYKAYSKETEDYIYSQDCIRDIIKFVEEKISVNDEQIQKGLHFFGIQINNQQEYTLQEKLLSGLIKSEKIIKENKNVLTGYFNQIVALIGAIKSFYTEAIYIKDNMAKEFSKQLNKIPLKKYEERVKKSESRKESTTYKIALKNLENAQKEFQSVLENSSSVMRDENYFQELVSLGTMLKEEVSVLENLLRSFKLYEQPLRIYECIEKCKTIVLSYELLAEDIVVLCNKYNQFYNTLFEKHKTVLECITAFTSNHTPCLSYDFYQSFEENHNMFTTFYDNIFYTTYLYIMEKAGVVPDESGRIEALPFSPYLYLQIMYTVSGVPKNPNEILVMIDEAQNLSVEEIRLIKAVNNNKVVLNLFGDEKQRIENTKGLSRWKDLQEVFSFEQYNLQENYRNALQITEYCNKKFRTNMFPVNVGGKGVTEFSDLSQFISCFSQRLVGEISQGLCAVIVKNNLEAEWIIDNFSTFSGFFNNLTLENHMLKDGFWNIITVENAKGLEFSTGLVIMGNMSDNEKYIACTRILDDLMVYEEALDVSEYEIQEISADTRLNKSEIPKETVVKKKSEKPKEIIQQSSLRKYFEDNGLTVIDDRHNSGKLWVVGERTDISEYINQAAKQFKVTGRYLSDANLKIKSGWCTKSKK